MSARAGVVALLLAFAAGAAPAPAQEADWNRFRAGWDPAADSKVVLSGLASAAAAMGDLPRFHAFLDSVVAGEPAGPNALQYWGAVSLQLGVPPDSVARRYGASLGEESDEMALVALVEVLESFDADAAALGLLERAAEAGVRADRLALVRGQLLARAWARSAAVDAWFLALAFQEDAAIAAAARIGDLVADGQGIPAGTLERLDALRAAARGETAGAIAALRVRLLASDGRWTDALAAAEDPVLGPEARGEALRSVARTAREARLLEAARAALEALVALGPPAARPEDRLALGEIEGAMGDPAAAAQTFGAARREGVTGARARELVAAVEAARASGEPEAIERALGQALAAGADSRSVAVPRGDLFLARSRADSALAAYAEGVGEERVDAGGLEALSRVRLAQALVRSGTAREVITEIGDALVRAPSNPAAASARFAGLAGRLGEGDSLGVARSLVLALAAEWEGRGGDPAGASEAFEEAALVARSPGEVPALLLDAGRWAEAAGDIDRARRLWRVVVDDHADTPYALDARRRLSEGGR